MCYCIHVLAGTLNNFTKEQHHRMTQPTTEQPRCRCCDSILTLPANSHNAKRKRYCDNRCRAKQFWIDNPDKTPVAVRKPKPQAQPIATTTTGTNYAAVA